VSIALRSALSDDFEYCRRIYFTEMEWIIEKLHLNRPSQTATFQQYWDATQVRIITVDGADVGWLQTITQNNEIFLAQLFVDRDFQRRGVGTEVMRRLINEAQACKQAIRLNVVKINPCVRLYERLGFRVIEEDERKFYMKRDPGS
jgi:ribosomal protein S18 acetylase RimI-like enzyme